MVIKNNTLYVNNYVGDVSAVNINSGSLIWQTPTQSSMIYEDTFSLQTSDLTINGNSLFFSNNRNEFFSIDSTSGSLNWNQKINSNVRPTIFNDIIFTVTLEGFLTIIDSQSGNIIRITDIFNEFSKNKRKKIKPVGFILGSSNIYLTTDNGKLLVIDVRTGTTSSTIKIDNDKISRPSVVNQKLYIIKDNSIIKLN